MSEVQEVARAAAEASQFGTKALETTEKLGTFVAKVFNEPIRDAVGIIGDRLRFMRWERQVRLADKVNEILSQRGTTETRAVPPKLALPILENASLEDNDELQDLWAKLLANSMDPNFTEETRYAYLEIIKSLNPLDVRILNAFYNSLSEPEIDWANITKYNIPKEQICEMLSISTKDYEVSMYNLFRVQCLGPAIITGGVAIGTPTGIEQLTAYKGIDAVVMTPLGKNFIEACLK